MVDVFCGPVSFVRTFEFSSSCVLRVLSTMLKKHHYFHELANIYFINSFLLKNFKRVYAKEEDLQNKFANLLNFGPF